MEQFKAKLKLIFWPFLYMGAAWLAVYSFLHWLLVIQFRLINLSELTINYACACIPVFIILIIWLRPRLKLLKYSSVKSPMVFFIYITGLAWAIPTCIAQYYVETATGRITHLDSISQITTLPLTKYYTVKQFYSAKKALHVKVIFTVTGKHNTNFDMTAYLAVPLFNRLFPDTNLIAAMRKAANPKTLVLIDNKMATMQRLAKLPADSIRFMRYINPTRVMPRYGDTGKYGALAVVTIAYKLKKDPEPQKIWPAAWLCLKYSKTISNSLSRTEKDLNFRVFVAKCEADFKREPLDSLVYMDRLAPRNNDFEYYQAAVHSRNDVPDGEPLLLLPVYKPFAQHNGDRLFWIFASLAIDSTVFLLILLCYEIKDNSALKKRSTRRAVKKLP
ncbi:hypothetical protein [Mucilaginibacter flavus]|uniref:hypothetical protein n=1 Tax=Mucilaginibacter flavus TaxID=931504 RepID=UPI0025B40E65|nr:hypothetical protein [Mucilaginibacter flavus]MDN3579497.1 hypothetical protein [Mucilaginibacter flavus]